jgi:DHA2 family multidrug resistance protein
MDTQAAAIAPARPRISPWVIAMTVMLATFMEVLDTSVANVALPHIAGNLSSTIDETTWVLTSYLVANAVILPMNGWFNSLMGRKNFYLTCVTVFTVASFLCGMAPSLGWLIFFRILQGLGGGGLQPTAQAIIVESFPHEKQGAAMAFYGIGVVFAPIIGPVLGGWLTDNYSWHWIFLINIPVGILAFTLVTALIHDPPYLKRMKKGEGKQIDYIGFGLIALGLGSLEIVMDEGQRHDWFGSSFIIFFAIVAVVAIVSMIIYELNHEHPVVNLRLLKNKSFATSALMLFTLGFVLYGSTFTIPVFLQTMLGYDATMAGLVLSPGGIVILVSMPIVGQLMRKVDARILITYGLGMTAIGLFMMSKFSLDTGFHNAVIARCVQCMGLAALFIPINVSAYVGLPKEQINQASGLLNLFRNLGGSVGIAILSTILARRSQFHQSVLSANMVPGNPPYDNFIAHAKALFEGHGMAAVDAAHAAMGAAYGKLVQQASMLGMMDTFLIAGIITVAVMPLVFIMKRPAPPPKGEAMHME